MIYNVFRAKDKVPSLTQCFAVCSYTFRAVFFSLVKMFSYESLIEVCFKVNSRKNIDLKLRYILKCHFPSPATSFLPQSQMNINAELY